MLSHGNEPRGGLRDLSLPIVSFRSNTFIMTQGDNFSAAPYEFFLKKY